MCLPCVHVSVQNEKDEQYVVGFRYDYWSTHDEFHKAKYSSFKTELLSNKIYCIETELFNYVFHKAKYLMQCSDLVKSMRSEIDSINRIYCVKDDIALSESHIMAVILYTDYDILSYNFRSTFCRIIKHESSRSVKQRNREYWYWSKSLMETVNCFGRRICRSNMETFYHCTSLTHFSSFIAEFNSPTSTTTNLSVATLFSKSNNGLILQLKMYNNAFNGVYGKSLRYLNTSLMSTFAAEDECLFVSPPQNVYGLYLEMSSIYNVAQNKNYRQFIQSLSVFENLVNGINADSMMNLHARKQPAQHDKEQHRKVWKLMQYVVDNHTMHQNQRPMNWMQQCFVRWMESKERMNFDLIDLKNLYPEIANYFLFQKGRGKVIPNLLAFDRINAVFRNIECIVQWSTGYVDVSVLDALVTTVDRVNRIHSSRLFKISLYGIVNIDAFGDLLKFQRAFTGKNWRLAKDDDGLTLISN